MRESCPEFDIFRSLQYVEIETCSHCTRKCSWCLFGADREERRTFKLLEDNYIFNVLYDLKEIGFSGTIAFYSINEPLLDERIRTGELILEARKIVGDSIAINIITNGDLLDLKVAEALFTNGLSSLSVSCYDNKTFERASSLKQKNNRIGLLDQRRYLKGNWESNRSGYLFKNVENSYKDAPCFMPYFRTVIGWDGRIRICPHDMIGSVSLGNIKESRLLDLLRSEEYIRFRKSLSSCRKDSIPCKECNVDGSLKYALTHMNRASETKSIVKQLKKTFMEN